MKARGLNMRLIPLLFAVLCLSSTGVAEVKVLPVRLMEGHESDTDDSPMRVAARKLNIAVDSGPSDWFHVSFRDNVGFYLFYNQIRVTDSPSQFVIQRVTRTIEETASDGTTTESTDELVEAFKLLNGQLKAPDQHFGSFALGDKQRRVIRKTLEIGVASSLSGKPVEGSEWIGEKGTLYLKLHDYDDEGAPPEVVFVDSAKWQLEFAIESSQRVRLSVPALSISADFQSPAPVKSNGSPATEKFTLVAGQGIRDMITCGQTKLDEVIERVGAATATYPLAQKKRNVEFPQGCVIHVDENDVVQTIMTSPESKLSASLGDKTIAIGASRSSVLEILGEPTNNSRRDKIFGYPGLMVWLTGDQVSKLVVFVEPKNNGK